MPPKIRVDRTGARSIGIAGGAAPQTRAEVLRALR